MEAITAIAANPKTVLVVLAGWATHTNWPRIVRVYLALAEYWDSRGGLFGLVKRFFVGNQNAPVKPTPAIVAETNTKTT